MLHAGLFAPVVGVGIQHNAAVAGPAGDHIRARADGLGAVHTKLVACFLHVLLAHDGAGSGCQLIQETGKRIRQGNGKVGVINHLNAFQVGGGAIHHSFRTGNGRGTLSGRASIRVKVYLTSLAVSGVPSENVTPLRRVKS